jgi:hypothetical protein
MLPTGDVLLFSYALTGKGSSARRWNPKTGDLTNVTIPRRREIFCI